MRALFLISALLSWPILSMAHPMDQTRNKYAELWQQWKANNDKVYESAVEERVRFFNFIDNADLVARHNIEESLGLHSYTLELNKFADLTVAEYRATYLSKWTPSELPQNLHRVGASPPATQDWRDDGWVTPVKDQGQCGSCWSFSSTGSMEAQHKNVSGSLVSLSEQQLVDCDGWCFGCGGGNVDYAFHYWTKNTPPTTEAAYPYTAQNGKCQAAGKPVAATMNAHVDVASGDENALENAVGLVGPVSVAIDASHNSFQLYKSGIYDPSNCSTKNLDHAVLTVGYNANSQGKYWIVKNSWGTSWGQQGYIWMSKDNGNVCGIATDASYPIATS